MISFTDVGQLMEYLRMSDQKDTVVFRKFLSDSSNAYVSLTTNEYKVDEWVDQSVSLTLSDGSSNTDFYYSFNSQQQDRDYDDVQYERAVQELEAVRFAVTSAIEAVASAYMNTRLQEDKQQGELDLDEVQE
jgi:hypothetical protein